LSSVAAAGHGAFPSARACTSGEWPASGGASLDDRPKLKATSVWREISGQVASVAVTIVLIVAALLIGSQVLLYLGDPRALRDGRPVRRRALRRLRRIGRSAGRRPFSP
jgi:hypothetical protein